jgi:murein DD-endopeptidase MepM/ murein hydrolase activator NlpD
MTSLLFLLTLAGAFTVEPPVVPVGGLARVAVDGAEPSGTFDGTPLAFFRSGAEWIALVGIDLDRKPGRYPIHVTSGGSASHRDLVVRERRFPVERLTVPRKYTELDAATLRRARREQQLLDSLWARLDGERLWRGEFVMPADGPAGSPFGLRRFFNGEPRSPHAGVDFRAPAGAAVLAANRGRVTLAKSLFFTGNTIVLDHGLGLFTIYVHLSKMSVAEGAMVDKAAEIGKVGATGRATGPHLHFAVRVGEARVDPMALLGRPIDGADRKQ